MQYKMKYLTILRCEGKLQGKLYLRHLRTEFFRTSESQEKVVLNDIIYIYIYIVVNYSGGKEHCRSSRSGPCRRWLVFGACRSAFKGIHTQPLPYVHACINAVMRPYSFKSMHIYLYQYYYIFPDTGTTIIRGTHRIA